MRRRPWSSLVAVLLGGLLTPVARAQQPTAPEFPPGDIARLDIESLLEIPVVSPTKEEQRGAQTPAVVSVISWEEIQARGYTSLAEVLNAVPGLYDVYDLTTHNMGIRGINGGARASGNVLKLMIDGHPVDYRPTTGNFFGVELIPLELVERVEVIRGPASALYGANAFLGVVNVITKSGEALAGAHLVGYGAMVREHPGGGGALVVAGEQGPLELVAGLSALFIDRSGLELPASSPVLQEPSNPVAARGPSRNDEARPKSFFAKGSVGLGGKGRLRLFASIQNLDAGGEFQDFGPLSHGTRVAIVNQNYWLTYQVEPSKKLSLELSGHYLHGAPSSVQRLDLGRPDFVLLSSSGVEGFGASAGGRWEVHRRLTLTLGADFVSENHLLQTFDRLLTQDVTAPDGTVLRPAGTIIPGEAHGEHRVFRNGGALVQAQLSLGEDWSVVAGGRLDVHNIYGANPSARLGVVYAPREKARSLKLLYGSSFKAPSAVQLYTQPMTILDIQGNPDLKAQTAHTLELAGTQGLAGLGELSLNLFVLGVNGRVEFVQKGLYQQAQNILREWVVGGELESRFQPIHSLRLRLSGGVARTVSRTAGVLLTGSPEVHNPLFPTYQLRLIGEYTLPWEGLVATLELAPTGPRGASQSNALRKDSDYQVPAYLYTAVALSIPELHLWKKNPTRLSLRVSNVFNQSWTEPGFGGIDYPSQGITAFLTVSQSLGKP
ncbi:TonB-dependent siderophore receptor [Vitiosangium sp. GDMCC 1.1324]|uniref:TonB-dependent receptor plug domain-containing protein n=1 Tax=Vitiosangium sp. (strain GDMCC 1.1324) TaxID=2138576 RepID=UPI0011B3AFD7|nr:TonB-dependent receptor [Vitiosangium sp. GDMCC 1.1324]